MVGVRFRLSQSLSLPRDTLRYFASVACRPRPAEHQDLKPSNSCSSSGVAIANHGFLPQKRIAGPALYALVLYREQTACLVLP
jgi:hypothetical protein